MMAHKKLEEQLNKEEYREEFVLSGGNRFFGGPPVPPLKFRRVKGFAGMLYRANLDDLRSNDAKEK